ncbi:MAG: protease modulator HflC [Gammaproteobacteria bacterium HGW-Gammaproteobacteria-14]|nr:MAG: protease modulator HflC [Gammaproteobacteria bacterium HGW-Gammaproteobacteria-14]
MSQRSTMMLAVIALIGVIASESYYIVNETEKAVLKQFGKIVKTDIQPGLYPKMPFLQTVVRVDGRVLTHDVPTQPFLTSEKKVLNVDSFVIWRVADVERYITTLGSGTTDGFRIQAEAQQRVDGRVQQALRDEFSKRTVQEVVAGEREAVMNQVAATVNARTLEDMGIEVVDIRVKRVDWPDEVRGRVFDRMRAERARDAAGHRAEGREDAERIRADADRQGTVIIAEAYRDSQILRGAGDAEAAAIYARAFNRDAEFFRFYRSLEAYRHSLGSPEDLLVLEPDSDFFRYLKKSAGGR